MGPRKGFVLLFSLSLIASFGLIFFHESEFLTLVFVFINKVGITGSYVIVYIAFIKLIPNLYNSSVFGICNFTARIITICAPIVAEQKHPIPIVTNIGFLILGIIMALFLVEKLPKAI